MTIDCNQLSGRLRDICRGYDDSGYRVEMSDEKRLAYVRRLFPENAELELPTIPAEMKPAPRGLGDRISNTIKRMSLGKIRPCGGCRRRAARLNKLFPADIPPLQPIPYEKPVTRNLIYHIYPVKDNGIWQWNVNQLLQRISQFNGQKIIAVVTDSQSDSLETVQQHFEGHDVEFLHRANRKKLGEVVTFRDLLDKVMDDDPHSITFYGHAKGVSRKPSERDVIRHWTQRMYEACLDDPQAVEKALVSHGVAGAYRRHQRLGSAGWYFSGTFYWFRHVHVQTRNWEYIDKRHWGAESWPGTLFRQEEAVVLAVDHVGSLYHQREWRRFEKPRIKVTPSTQELTLITPTGDRPEAFQLCERWMSRQRYQGEYQWIVVDDGVIPTQCTQGQTYLRQKPGAKNVHSLTSNLMAAIPHVEGEKILIIEDDEWYAPEYLERMVTWLDEDELVGVVPARYYWPRLARYRELTDHEHCSLCRTGLRRSLLPLLAECCQVQNPSVDMRLWSRQEGRKFNVPLVVGMKQMPGRSSGGGSPIAGESDADLRVLSQWISDDAAAYRPILPKRIDPDRAIREKIVVFTVVLGNYDVIHPPTVVNPNIRYVAITEGTAPPPWEVINPPETMRSIPLASRRWKITGPELLPEADWTIYIDGQLQLACDPLRLLAECETWADQESDLFLFRHQDRECLYDEAREILRIGRDRITGDRIAPQVERYRELQFPDRAGLYLGGILIRRGGDRCRRFNNTWWNEVETGSHRDQISLPVALERSMIRFVALPAMWWSHFLKRHRHARSHRRRPAQRLRAKKCSTPP